MGGEVPFRVYGWYLFGRGMVKVEDGRCRYESGDRGG
jgi:hypothetical protein